MGFQPVASRYTGPNIKIYRNIILLVVWYGCGICSLTLRAESKDSVLENKMPRKISGPKKEVTRKWRRLQDEERHDSCSSPNTNHDGFDSL
jgi:hypothetical protein